MLATCLDVQLIPPDHCAYPPGLKTCAAFKTAPTLQTIGNLELLTQNPIGLFCSIICPGRLVLKTYELIRGFRDDAIPVISGFHSPIEQDCLSILQHGTQPIIQCPAHSLDKMFLSRQQKQAIENNRLLLISPFSANHPRATSKRAQQRNEMIASIADLIFIAHAAPNSKTQAFVDRLLQTRKVAIAYRVSSIHASTMLFY